MLCWTIKKDRLTKTSANKGFCAIGAWRSAIIGSAFPNSIPGSRNSSWQYC